MADPRRLIKLTDAELGAELSQAAADFSYPATPQLYGRVMGAIEAKSARPHWFSLSASLLRRVPIYAGLALLLAVISAFAIPPVRSAVANFFHVQGVVIKRAPSPLPSISPTGSPRNLLGEQVTLSQARAGAAFLVLVPARLGPPDAVYLDDRVPGDVVTLVYLARPGIPVEPQTGYGIVITEFRGDLNPEYLEKNLNPTTKLQETSLAGAPAYWIAGTPHELVVVGVDGEPREEPMRMAANTLIWARQGVTYRIESLLSEQQSLAIAGSMKAP
jgi:hypothetical protein